MMPDNIILNPYAVIPHLIRGKFYIGGWSAAVFHDLIGDLPLNIWVMTETTESGHYQSNGIQVRCIRIPTDAFFGTIEKSEGLPISDIHKTALDALIYPQAFGGIPSATHVWHNYKNHPDKDINQILSYAKQIKNNELISFILKEALS